jgi:hypothetical protein
MTTNNKHYWFNCGCVHDFKTEINNVTGDGGKCPYCLGNSVCGKGECVICHPKSFASYKGTINNKLKIDCYHLYKNGNKKPINININSETTHWFYCNKCKCDFEKKITNITNHNDWCQYCK